MYSIYRLKVMYVESDLNETLIFVYSFNVYQSNLYCHIALFASAMYEVLDTHLARVKMSAKRGYRYILVYSTVYTHPLNPLHSQPCHFKTLPGLQRLV